MQEDDNMKGLIIKTPKKRERPVHYAMAHPSVAHTYGNVAYLIAEHIKEIFPPNFFKTVHISTTIAHKQISIQRARNKEFFKKSKPMLIIRPRIEIDTDDDTFLNGTLFTERMGDLYFQRDFSNLQPFFEDDERGVKIKYLLNRYKMSFDINIVTETQMEQINIAHYIRNSRRINNHPYFIPACLESPIPLDLVRMISKEYNVPIKNIKNNPNEMIKLLSSYSCYPITYKNMKSSGNDEFFRYYKTNIEVIPTQVNIDDGDKIDYVMDSYSTTYSMNTQFFGSGLYYYFTYNSKLLVDLKVSLATDNKIDKIIPLFTISDIYENKKMPLGWILLTNRLYQVDEGTSRENPDILPLDSILEDSIFKIANYHDKNSLDKELFIKFQVYMDNEELSSDDFEVDWKNNQLLTKRIVLNKSYRLLVHVNRHYINELIKREYELE